MKRIFPMLLCLLLLTSLAACAGEAPLVGIWEMDIPLAEAFAANGVDFEGQFGSFSGQCRLRGVRLTFREDGTVTAAASIPEITAGIEEFVRDFFQYLEDGGLYDFFEASGVGREEMDTYMAMQRKTMEDFVADIKAQMSENLDIPKISRELAQNFVENGVEENHSGVYEAVSVYELRENGILLTAEQEAEPGSGTAYVCRLSQDQNTLTLTSDDITLTFLRQK